MTTGWTSCASLTPIGEKAFKRYSDYYLSTNGQTYWSDTNQLSAYLPNYAQKIRDQLGGDESSLIITEIYVPRPDLPDFLAQAADLLRSNRTTVIYGTVRLVEKDDGELSCMGQAILRLYHFQFAHASIHRAASKRRRVRSAA